MGWAAFGASSGRHLLASSSSSVFISLTAKTSGYLSIGFLDAGASYGAMSPANVWAGSVDGASAQGALRFWRNAKGHDDPVARATPAGATLLGASRVGGLLTVNFSIPMPSGAAELNMNWAIGDGSAAGMAEHGGEANADFGAAQVNLLCAGGSGCVLRTDAPESGFTQLDLIAIVGFGATVAAAAVTRAGLSAGGRRIRALVHAPLLRWLRRLPGRPLPEAHGWALPELLLAAGYFATLAVYLREAAETFPDSYGHALGSLLAPAWAVALLPVARASVLLRLLGASYERAAAAHRTAAVVALALTAAHVARTAQELGASSLALRLENASGKGNAFGTAAATLMGAMAVLASGPVRRASFMLFKASHLVLFPIAMLLACLHAKVMIGYVVPPLILWALDRALGWCRGYRAKAARVTPLPGGAVRLDVCVPGGGLLVKGGQWAYINVAQVSHIEWHPFSLACGGAGAVPDEATFIIGGADSSPSSFAARLRALVPPGAGCADVTARLDGPYGRPALPLTAYSSLVLVAGGVGVTPCVSLAAAALARGPKGPSLTLLWAVRDPEALTAWLPGWLSWLAHCGVRVLAATTGQRASAVEMQARPPARQGGPRPQLGEAGDAMESGRHSHSQAAALTLAGVTATQGRPDVAAAVADAVVEAVASGKTARDVAVFVCGPPSLVDAAYAAAAAAGCACAAEHFGL